MSHPLEGPGREGALERRLTLSDVLDIPTFTELVRGFADLYKVGVKVFDERGRKLADIKIGSGDFCGYVFSFPEGRRCCSATVARVKEGPIAAVEGARTTALAVGTEGLGMVTVPCFTGLRYLVLPVLWEGDTLGRVVFGPFQPDELKNLPRSLLELAPGLDLKLASEHLAKIRRAPEATVSKVLGHLAHLLQALVAAGYKTYLTSQVHIETMVITNRELEEKNRVLEQTYTQLKELDRLKSSFLATVSHELRTPLTSIIGYSEMLSEGLAGPLNAEQTEYLKTITDKGDTLLRLISSILDISQIEAGKVRLHFEPVGLAEVMRQSVSSVAPQAQRKGLTLRSLIPSGEALTGVADREKLRQVLVNLLANAVKFTPSGGRVTLSLGEMGPQPALSGVEGYVLRVQDSGVGIPADHLGRIFESFYQVDSSSTREFGGAGLGLAIVKSYVEGHGGRVLVESELGKGSLFSVIFPLNPPSPKSTVLIEPPAVDMGDRF